MYDERAQHRCDAMVVEEAASDDEERDREQKKKKKIPYDTIRYMIRLGEMRP